MQNPIKQFQGTIKKGAVLLAAISLSASVSVAQAQNAAPDMQKLQQMMGQQISLMKPELQEKVKALSPQTKKLLLQIYGQHTRHSDKVTLRQVMHEVLSDYHSMVTGVLTDNAEQAADSARRLANHRIPIGGLVPYLDIKFVNDEGLSALAGFNDAVEGNAKRLAAAADEGDMIKASALVGDITQGCFSCHSIFRGVPGKSALLR
ncbi:cytochrome c [Sedimenticola selenatireducens]|uniref:cytochrome c n=1 Tax=Sedimenticola selenatireducens TaxID=191960 RepID=UPI0004B48C33|nr:cytochrome c [Sedimenticola selenatireducens]